MINNEKPLKILEKTLEKYRMNIENVDPKDLAGRYKASFMKLKEQLARELNDYFLREAFRDLAELVAKEDYQSLMPLFKESFARNSISKRVSKALKEYDLVKIGEIAEQQFRENVKIYYEYLCEKVNKETLKKGA